MEHLIIWDDNASRINEMEASLKKALSTMGLKALVTSNCEPPLLSRMQMIGTTPAIEAGGEFWRCEIGKAATYEQFLSLLKGLCKRGVFDAV